MKLYWKIYMLLAFTTLFTLTLSLWITARVLPAHFEKVREENLRSFEIAVMELTQPTEVEVRALADSFEIGIRLFPNNQSRTMPAFTHQPPPEREWRGVRIIAPPRFNYSILASAQARSPRLTLLILLAAGLFISQALALAIGLKSVFSRVATLTKVTGRFGEGNLSVRYLSDKSKDEIGKLGRSFNTMASRINSLLGAHSELLNAVAHELRTPLARLTFALQLAKDNPQNANEKLNLMQKDIFELDKLVSELLEFNKIAEVETLSKEKVSLLQLCENAAEGERSINSKITISVAPFSGSSTILADYRLLLRAVSNLIRNSLIHANSTVEIQILKERNSISIKVSDDGPGFPPGFIQKATNPFIKGHDSKGVGLGLSIVNRIAERHSGTLSLSNPNTGGASATISIPLSN